MPKWSLCARLDQNSTPPYKEVEMIYSDQFTEDEIRAFVDKHSGCDVFLYGLARTRKQWSKGELTREVAELNFFYSPPEDCTEAVWVNAREAWRNMTKLPDNI